MGALPPTENFPDPGKRSQQKLLCLGTFPGIDLAAMATAPPRGDVLRSGVNIVDAGSGWTVLGDTINSSYVTGTFCPCCESLRASFDYTGRHIRDSRSSDPGGGLVVISDGRYSEPGGKILYSWCCTSTRWWQCGSSTSYHGE